MNEQQFSKAIEAVKEKSPKRKFVESIDMAINLKDVNLKDPSKRFQIDVILPHEIEKEIKICLFGEGSHLIEAQELKISKIIDRKELENISRDPKLAKKIAQSYDFFISSAQLMPVIGKTLGRYLGPRGKMPRPVPPTEQLEPLVKNYSRIVKLRLRQNPVVHSRIGTINMDTQYLAENAMAVLRAVEGKLERGASNIKSIYLKSTMGPSVKVE
ncbi:MAG: 50S ribosomal protein L1 [Candidatus Heimdallarchaeaceae archaeon]